MNRLLEPHGRVLAFGAHPDDIELGAGGLIARLAADGAQVTLAVVTVPTEIERRRDEARASAELFGAKLRFIFDERCRVEDVPMHEIVRRFDQVIADVQPDLVITHAEQDLHWDHGLVHRATLSALRRTPCDLLAYLSSPEMNAQARTLGGCFADISETIETKLAAVACHASQVGKLDLESTRDLARAMGRISGFEYAETFEVLRVRI